MQCEVKKGENGMEGANDSEKSKTSVDGENGDRDKEPGICRRYENWMKLKKRGEERMVLSQMKKKMGGGDRGK